MIPIEAVLAGAVIAAVACIVSIHINEAVALGHLPCSTRDKVYAAPHRIANQVNAIQRDGIVHCLNMLPQIVDAVGVVYFAILKNILCAKTIFHNYNWDLVTPIDLIQIMAQPQGIDCPAPFRGPQIGILFRDSQISERPIAAAISRNAAGGIIRD